VPDQPKRLGTTGAKISLRNRRENARRVVQPGTGLAYVETGAAGAGARCTTIIGGFEMLITICVGIIAGFLAGKIMKGAGYGILVDLLLGLVGGVIGGWLFGMLGIGGGGIIWSILVATVGAVILVWLVHMIKGNSSSTV
jgi:uncharacterized membrane protein YeaQ/YmgE (transglycosylase-associated protein family)